MVRSSDAMSEELRSTRLPNPKNSSSRNTPGQGLVWPPPESEIDSYILVLKPGGTFLPIGAPEVVAAPETVLEPQRPEPIDWLAPISVLATTESGDFDFVTAPQA